MFQHIDQPYDASPNDEKFRLLSSSKHLSWKVMTAPNVTLSPRKWFLNISRITLLGALAFSGCSSEHSSQQAKQTPQQKESTAVPPVHKEVGEASWYGPGFQGRETSSGELFDQGKMTAAHPSLPMGTKAEVTNLENDKKVEVKINDRGPYVGNRVIDLSNAAAKKLKRKDDGIAKVKIVAKPAKKKRRIVQPKKKKQKAKKSASSKRR